VSGRNVVLYQYFINKVPEIVKLTKILVRFIFLFKYIISLFDIV